jgi:hypothetical protein
MLVLHYMAQYLAPHRLITMALQYNTVAAAGHNS